MNLNNKKNGNKSKFKKKKKTKSLDCFDNFTINLMNFSFQVIFKRSAFFFCF